MVQGGLRGVLLTSIISSHFSIVSNLANMFSYLWWSSNSASQLEAVKADLLGVGSDLSSFLFSLRVQCQGERVLISGRKITEIRSTSVSSITTTRVVCKCERRGQLNMVRPNSGYVRQVLWCLVLVSIFRTLSASVLAIGMWSSPG